MPLAFWCVLAAGLMPIVVVGFAKADSSFDNAHPRDWLERQEGFRKRAHAAHLNAFEAFPLFAAGVFVAMWQGAAQPTVDAMASGFLLFRIAYAWAYLTDRAMIRTLFWLAATALSIGLFMVGAFA